MFIIPQRINNFSINFNYLKIFLNKVIDKRNNSYINQLHASTRFEANENT